jgi:hypothetical protein
MRCFVLLAALVLPAFGGTAHADDLAAPPEATGRLVTKVVEMTNGFLDEHVDRLSLELLHVRVDAEQRRANVVVGGGDARVVKLRLASNVEVVDGTARVRGRLALGLGGKQLDVRLPTIDVASVSYRGERGVEVRLPLVSRAF